MMSNENMMSNETISPQKKKDTLAARCDALTGLPFPNAQVWIYTEQPPSGERKLATVVDPKMIDSRILHSITIPPNALFTARFNKECAEEERRLREWPDDSKWSPDEFVSVLNDENINKLLRKSA